MTLLVRNLTVSLALALSDFLGFVISPWLAIVILSGVMDDVDLTAMSNLDGWIALHWVLAFCCIGWFSVRLRHYFYRKTFWFELKEILRTLTIFAIIEIAVMAFTTWSFSRFLWVLSWFLSFF